ncbi:MAG: ABC transporter permease, partial [Clostridiales bacterium]|nr:ABC transporter permease [Clostridiales bacterium]
IGGQKYLLNIIIVLAITIIMYIYLKYSKHGYEISVVGESENTARYIGINVKKVIIRTMLLSGAICGIAGFLLVSGTNHTISTSTADNRGFTAIMVSWLAKFNPLVMILTSFLLVFMDKGASEIATVYRIDQAFSDIITGILLFFIIGCEFFINYKIVFNTKHKKAEIAAGVADAASSAKEAE